MAAEFKSGARESDNARPLSAVPDTSAAEAALKAKLSRKRTKTGCLTCRKRRIKCGEERPVCKNCVKSKRHCEGYNQRVVFKPPTFEYQQVPNGGAHIIFQAGPVPGHVHPHGDSQPPFQDPAGFPHIRPRAFESQQYATLYDPQLQQFVTIPQPGPHFAPPAPTGHNPFQQHQFFQQESHAVSSEHAIRMAHHSAGLQDAQMNPQMPMGHPGMLYSSASSLHPELSNMAASEPGIPPATLSADWATQAYGQSSPHLQQPFTPRDGLQINTHSNPPDWPEIKPAVSAELEQATATPASSHSSSTLAHSRTPMLVRQHQWMPGAYQPRSDFSQPVDVQHHHEVQYTTPTSASFLPEHGTPEFYEHEAHPPQYVTPTSMLNAAAVETQDDDYYDVDPEEEEMDLDTPAGEQDGDERQRALSRILALNRNGSHDLHMRRYDTFIYTGVLDRYRVEEVASPLRNPATARIFAHFISVTGPSLSIFERHPRSSSVLFAKGSIPFSQQGLWTYTMPMAALRNQGLLHAMLALASLHIARLQNASVTPSMQHYAWALRRIHASVANHQNSRLKVTTIAASMLLGFYEIMTADHMKWNMHLAGSKQLFVETDFVKMTREFRRLKAERASRYHTAGRLNGDESCFQDDRLDQIPDVDESVISHFTGSKVRYDNHGQVETPHMAMPSGLDLSKFEILKDLYWWYCKQDVYQSIVSGNPLLMDYSRWANCPPRAPLGRADAMYGTFDHLILLLGRIADFASKDRHRKLKQMALNGGQWKPAAGMNIPRPPQPPPTNGHTMPGASAGTPLKSPSDQPGSAMPQFFGMAPPPRANVQMPASYNPNYSIPTPQSAHPTDILEYDLKTATDTALEEYGRIRAALRTFATSLGEAFEPLSSEYQTPMNTAFGTARFYRSYDIGCMWGIYNMAEIIAIRSHPHMPPAAHVAAAIAAPQTASYANEIGRIAAGIVPGPSDQPLNPTLGASLCEICMPLFFAAIQYQDPHQRHETVTRIFSTAKRTGWGSAELIANGCETSWVKAAAAHRGPPYQRIVRRPQEFSEDPRLNGSWEHLDPNALPEENDEGDRRLIGLKKEARLNWAIGVMGVEDDVQKIRITDLA